MRKTTGENRLDFAKAYFWDCREQHSMHKMKHLQYDTAQSKINTSVDELGYSDITRRWTLQHVVPPTDLRERSSTKQLIKHARSSLSLKSLPWQRLIPVKILMLYQIKYCPSHSPRLTTADIGQPVLTGWCQEFPGSPEYFESSHQIFHPNSLLSQKMLTRKNSGLVKMIHIGKGSAMFIIYIHLLGSDELLLLLNEYPDLYKSWSTVFVHVLCAEWPIIFYMYLKD